VDDDIDWSLLKPDIFAAIMDFFATDQPILNKEAEPASTETDSGLYVIGLLYDYCLCLQCFDTVGWASGRAFGL